MLKFVCLNPTRADSAHAQERSAKGCRFIPSTPEKAEGAWDERAAGPSEAEEWGTQSAGVPWGCSWGPQSGCSRTLVGGPPDGICEVVSWVHCPLVSSKFVVVSGCVAYLLPAFPKHSAVLMPSVSGGGNTPQVKHPARLEKQRSRPSLSPGGEISHWLGPSGTELCRCS